MEELFLYDRDKGLFKKICEQSLVIGGRYQISDDEGANLNASNFDTLVPKIEGQKYPACICMTPASIMTQENGQDREVFTFRLLFLCTTYYGQNQPQNRETNVSDHEVWYDWQDMKAEAKRFFETLRRYARKKLVGQFYIDDGVKVRRLSKLGNERLSGVLITFTGSLFEQVCDPYDLPTIDINAIIHAEHKH